MATKKGKVDILTTDNNSQESAILKTTTTVSTPPAEPIPEFEKPLVSVSINNPFKKILYWLNQIRKRQTTTLAFKVSIPLIALPIVIFAAFQIGRGTGISFQKKQVAASPAPTEKPTASQDNLPQVQISKSGTLKVAKGDQTRYLLSLRNGQIMNLEIPEGFDLTKYANKQVLVTGIQDKTTGVLKVTDIAEVEVFNPTVVQPQESSPSATPTSQQ